MTREYLEKTTPLQIFLTCNLRSYREVAKNHVFDLCILFVLTSKWLSSAQGYTLIYRQIGITSARPSLHTPLLLIACRIPLLSSDKMVNLVCFPYSRKQVRNGLIVVFDYICSLQDVPQKKNIMYFANIASAEIYYLWQTLRERKP